MNVTVVWAVSGVQDVIPVTLPPGATVADAVACSCVAEHYTLDLAQLRFAVFGRRAAAEATLSEGDRIEITRPLVADPMESRHRRARANPLPKAAPKSRPRTGT
jgi:uncharacterized protein